MAQSKLCDTHCHIHGRDYPLSASEVLPQVIAGNVNRIITMGSNPSDSQLAVQYAERYCNDELIIKAGAGLYPHEVDADYLKSVEQLKKLINTHPQTVVAIGEIGLDYCYDTVPRSLQLPALEAVLQLSVDANLPVSLHVRSGDYGDAFADLCPVLANFGGRVKGVLHSFTDNLANMTKVLEAGLYVGVNGIVSFNRDPILDEVYLSLPLERIVLETDSPYLSPKPFRGKTNHPGHIKEIAERLADIRELDVDDVAQRTTANALAIYPGLA